MHDDAAVAVGYLHPIADQLRAIGVNVEQWLSQSRFSAAEFARPDGMIPFRVFRRLVRNGLSAAQEPALGLFVGARLVASTHGVVGAAAVNSGTVRQALETAERFSRVRTSLITLSHQVEDDQARLLFAEVLPLEDIARPVLEAVVLSIKLVLDDITMGASNIERVTFSFERPEYAALACDMFGCKVEYGQSQTALLAAPEILALPLKLADPVAFREAARICQGELDRIAANESMSARVRRVLLENQGGFPSLPVTARLFRMTPRTLHRRLAAEGSSYRDQLESVRHSLAVQHLSSSHFTIEEIAYRLGYTDLANFRRAFKRWEGMAPSAYAASRASSPRPS